MIAAGLVACGSAPPPEKPAPAGAPQARPTDEERFRAAHFRACDAMCSLLTRCSQVELREHWDELSDEDRAAAEQIGPAELRAHTEQCAGACQDSSPSVRQVRVVQDCVAGLPAEGLPTPAQCEELVRCLDAAQPRRPGSAAP
ncbi:MAG: hypothetical protein D6689_08595 [Deltaproteobacteria bacterium]|nr:MAG: hypothetical protein D6689_08595 [Deltaproteobacteria bacterium]